MAFKFQAGSTALLADPQPMVADMTVPIEQKLRFLMAPGSYGGAVAAVQAIETHMSHVFLAGERVYKLKKPVRFPLLDFTRLDAREHNCREEVRLNRRLAPDVYLGVIALVRRDDGSLSLGGAGEVVDWLVEMRRLPDDRMLDVMLERDLVDAGQIARLVKVLSGFYRGAAAPGMALSHFLCLETQQDFNRQILNHREFDIDHVAVRQALSGVDCGLHRFRPLIEARIASGRYVEGHGDLRPQHICLTDPIVIFDCLEFNRELRFVDPFDELAFLGMECAFLGQPQFGETLLARMKMELADPIPAELIHFYTAFRAAMRARMALGHLVYGSTGSQAVWEAKADRYIQLCLSALARIGPAPAGDPGLFGT